MANIKLYFRTLNRREEKKASDAQAIAEIVSKYSIEFGYTVFKNSLVIFNVYHLDRNIHISLIADICTAICQDSRYKSVSLTSFHNI